MTQTPAISTEAARAGEVGILRIYLDPRERVGTGRSWFSRRLAFRDLIQLAKSAGLMVGLVNQSPFAFTIGDVIAVEGFKAPVFEPLVTVELIGRKKQLIEFCARHHPLLRNKIVLYQSAEHWSTLQPVPLDAPQPAEAIRDIPLP